MRKIKITELRPKKHTTDTILAIKKFMNDYGSRSLIVTSQDLREYGLDQRTVARDLKYLSKIGALKKTGYTKRPIRYGLKGLGIWYSESADEILKKIREKEYQHQFLTAKPLRITKISKRQKENNSIAELVLKNEGIGAPDLIDHIVNKFSGKRGDAMNKLLALDNKGIINFDSGGYYSTKKTEEYIKAHSPKPISMPLTFFNI